MKKNKDNVVRIRAVVPLDEGTIEVKKNRKKQWMRIGGLLGVIGILVAGGFMIFTQTQTYANTSVNKYYSDVSVTNSRCQVFLSGILRFGKDGVSYLDDEGQAIWNYAYEITNPIIETTSASAAIADVGGNTIVVMTKDGVKGEIETVLPIERIAVSEQGIVAALVQDESTPQVVCYDAVGNVLVEHKTSLSGTGYPIGVALSPDGTVLLVSYLQVGDDGLVSNYAYYYFGDDNLVSSSQVASGEKEGAAISEVHFLTDEISVMISNEGIEYYKGITETEFFCEVEIEEEIQSVFYGDEQVGVLIKGASGESNELRVYNASGEIIVAQEYTGEYTNVDIVNNQIILYEGYNCLIYSMQGILKFDGEMPMELLSIYPVFGINKYIIIGNDGMEEIRLAR